MDIIYIRDLRVETVIGIYDWERRIRQTVRLDIDLATDIHKAAASDDIADTLSYKDVAKRVAGFIGASEFLLLEAMAERTAELILTEFPTPWIRLTVGKPSAVTGASEVGVTIERGRR